MKTLIIIASFVFLCAGCASQKPYYSETLTQEQSAAAQEEIQKRADELKAQVQKNTVPAPKWYEIWK